MYSKYLIVLLIVIDATQTQLIAELASSHSAPAPVDIAIKDTKFVETKKPLTFFTPLIEPLNVNNTGTAIDISSIKPHSVGSVRYGVLGDDVYEYFKFRFYWNDNVTDAGHYSYTTIDGKGGTRLEAVVFFYNRKYGSYKNAVKHSDGLVQAAFRINIIDGPPNTLFCPLEYLFKKIQKPNHHLCALGSFTYLWYVYYPHYLTYHAYRGSYTDEETGQIYPATTLVAPLVSANYISLKQFKGTFGSLKDCSGKPLVNVAPQAPRGCLTVVQAKGINIINLPA